jgi:hypothetical protein
MLSSANCRRKKYHYSQQDHAFFGLMVKFEEVFAAILRDVNINHLKPDAIWLNESCFISL